jgi:hypothetical protein
VKIVCIYLESFWFATANFLFKISYKLTTEFFYSRLLMAIRYVLAFSIIVFLQGVLCIFTPSCTYIYSSLWPSDEYKRYS